MNETTASASEPAAMGGRFRRACPSVKPRAPERLATDALECAACPPPAARSGRCAIVGRPNVGKSTLLNTLLGQKLSIATPKPQTTRTCILGVYVQKDPPLQIAFVDTPGLHEPQNALGRALLEQAKAGVTDADVILLVAQVGSHGKAQDVLGQHERTLLESLRGGGRPVVLAINKVDRLKHKPLLLPCIEACSKPIPFAAIVPICARAPLPAPALAAARRQWLAGVGRRARPRICRPACATTSPCSPTSPSASSRPSSCAKP